MKAHNVHVTFLTTQLSLLALFLAVFRSMIRQQWTRQLLSATLAPLPITIYSGLSPGRKGFPMLCQRFSSLVLVQFPSTFSQPVNQSNPSRRAESLKRDFAEGRSALVVDDVSDVTEMLSVLLTHAGYYVVTASSARAALEAVHKQHFDVIISDIGMPEMNGYQLAREIRLLPDYVSVPMIAVTGYSMFDDRQRSLSAGFNAHLTKPIDPRSLLDLIEHL